MCFLILFSDKIDFLWKHDYELNSLLLRKTLPFTMCFPTLFPDGRTGETPTIYYVLPHSISRFSLKTRMSSTPSYWGNPYHLLCASPFYFPTGALGKPLPFTMCFLILFLDFLWKHAWAQPALTGEIPIIYYVLPHPIPRFSLKTRMDPTRSYWGNPYHLLWASPSGSSYSPAGALSLGKPLLFTMCFSILFSGGLDFLWKHAWAQPALTGETPIIYYVLPHRVPRRAHCHWGNLYYLMGASPLDRVIGETSIIYYVLPHPILRRAPWGHPYYLLCASPSDRVPRRAHCHWGTLYYFVCASPSCSSASALPLGKPLLFSGCFPSYRCSRLGTDPDRGRCQAIPRDIGETSII